MTERSTAYYPVYLNLRDRPVVVIGGGPVAERKVAALRASGARIRLVSPDLTPGLERLAGEGAIEAVRRGYCPGDLRGAYLAIVGTDDRTVNRTAANEARAEGVLVNTVDDVGYCDFIAPAVVQRGDITIAISTNGKSPAMARLLREELEGRITPEYGDLLEVMETVRRELRSRRVAVPPEAWQRHVDQELRALVRNGDLDNAAERLLGKLLGDSAVPGEKGV